MSRRKVGKERGRGERQGACLGSRMVFARAEGIRPARYAAAGSGADTLLGSRLGSGDQTGQAPLKEPLELVSGMNSPQEAGK